MINLITPTNKYNPRLIKIMCYCGIFFPIISLFTDIPIINEVITDSKPYLNWYIASRIITAIIHSIALGDLLITKKVRNYQAPTIFITALIYSIIGQAFLPAYYLSYMQVLAAYSLFFPFEKKLYYISSLGFTAIMILALIYSPVGYTNDPKLVEVFQMDSFFGVLIMAIFSISGYKFVTLFREKKDIESHKFLDVGRNISSVVHEIKGLMSGPRVYFKILNREIERNPEMSPQIKLAVSNLERDYQNLLDYVQAVNNLTINDNNLSLINVRGNIENVMKTLFATQSKIHSITIEGDAQVYASNEVIKRSVVNLVNNSVENFVIKGIEKGTVKIVLSANTIKIEDNGGGFSQESLKKINKNESFTTKSNGTGLGLYMIKNDVVSVGGKMKVYNSGDGAVTEMTFKANGGING